MPKTVITVSKSQFIQAWINDELIEKSMREIAGYCIAAYRDTEGLPENTWIAWEVGT